MTYIVSSGALNSTHSLASNDCMKRLHEYEYEINVQILLQILRHCFVDGSW